jgi:precorrin-6Y C5,15-methyltransferase (decarboxylating)
VEKVQIIGIGDDGVAGLTAAARKQLEAADAVIGIEQTLALLPTGKFEQLAIGNDLDKVVETIKANPDSKYVILASGDPLFFGTARFLTNRLGKERFQVTPHVSTMQLAFARVMESWDEAYLADLANHRLEAILDKMRVAEKVGLFTTETCTPADVAQALLDRQIDYFTVYVCENLGSPDECVTQDELAAVADQQFATLNVLILIRKPNAPDRPAEMIGHRLFGNPDEAFSQSKPKHGLLTPAEVRSLALAEMDLGPGSIVWDVGAGSGSISIEAAQIAREGTVFAIEMEVEDHQLLAANIRRFGVANVTPIIGAAPEAWEELPAPDAIFVGGSGRTVPTIVEQAVGKLKPGGRIVVNVNSMENVNSVRQVMLEQLETANVWMLQISRGTEQLERMRFEALNPTFVLSGMKALS